MYNIINNLVNILSSVPFLLVSQTLSLAVKSYIITKLFLHRAESTQFKRAWTLLIFMLIGSATEDFSWIVNILQKSILPNQSLIPNIDYRFVIFTIRLAWAFAVIQYQSLTMLIETLIPSKDKWLSIVNQISLVISSAYFIMLAWLALFKTINLDRPPIEFSILTQVSIYLPTMALVSLLFAFIRIKQVKIPKILKKQLNIFMIGLIGPRVISDIIQLYPFNLIPNYVTSSYAVIGTSSIITAYIAYFCINSMLRLRFMNLKKHVVSVKTNDFFIDQFKLYLDDISNAITTQELNFIVKKYFKEAINIADGKTNLYIRNINNNEKKEFSYLNRNLSIKENTVENFITTNKNNLRNIPDTLILVLDEIEFNYFYQRNDLNKNLLNFLHQIESEIFIPIFQDKTIIAYITIDRDPYSKRLYSNIERDKITVFAKYLGNVINLMQKRNLDTLVEQEKSLKEEIYQKHQQINQYKESIKSFIKQSHHKKIGILFYKSRKFIFGNQDAKEIVNFNINSQPGHPLTKKLNLISKQVENYKSPQNCFAKDTNGNKIILTAIPNLEQNNVIITIHYPDITDIIKKQIDLLADPTQWDYLLYLETTKSGQLINKLIPGSGELILGFKIELLKIALSKKATLISMPEDDLIPTVELIHHISLRNTLYTLKLHSPAINFDTPMQLFGINPIFNNNLKQEKPLLQKLNGNGTLFIQNIHYLGLEAQKYLAEFIKYGFYHIFRGEQKQFSDVRIICSTNQNLQTLVHEGKFSKALYEELQKTSLIMPSLLTMPKGEINKLIEDVTNETLGNSATFKDLLELNDKEKQNLINKSPASIREFKTKIQHLLTEKSKENNIHVDTQFDPAYDISDPKLSEAVKLGKYALKDPKIMSWMWNKFKNQNKIANLLGVNRSSVHRRCKEYNLY